MPAFDIVSELDLHEVTNAVDQAKREISNRFDFKGVNASFEQKENCITLLAEADFQLKQLYDILENKLIKRGIDVNCAELADPEVNVAQASQLVTLRQGLDTAQCKKLIKMLKEAKLKVQSTIQGEQVRVTGKKRDDLQAAIQLLKQADFEMPLQFTNFRD